MSRIRIGTRGSVLARWQAEHVKGRLDGARARGGAAWSSPRPATACSTGGWRPWGARAPSSRRSRRRCRPARSTSPCTPSRTCPPSLPDGPRAVRDAREGRPPRRAAARRGAALRSSRRGRGWARRACGGRRSCGAVRPDLVVADLRGNVDTRMRRLREGDFDAILLAMAGLVRLGRAGGGDGGPRPARRSCRPRGRGPSPSSAGRTTGRCARRWRRSTTSRPPARWPPSGPSWPTLGGGCNVPLGAHAFAAGDDLEIVGFVARADGTRPAPRRAGRATTRWPSAGRWPRTSSTAGRGPSWPLTRRRGRSPAGASW